MQAQAQPQTESLVKGWRIKTVLAVFALAAFYITAHLFKLQIVDYSLMIDKLLSQTTQKDIILPVRGRIFDAKGYLLAGNTLTYDLYVDTTERDTDDLLQIAGLIGPAIGMSAEDLYAKVHEATVGPVLVKRQLDKDTSTRIHQLASSWTKLFDGDVWMDESPARAYPNGEFAAHVLGYLDFDRVGQYGVEQFYNEDLAGTPGWFTAERDSKGQPLPVGISKKQPAIDGSDIQLTIDSAVQEIAERELANTLQQTGAEKGMILIMDPKTGEIMALANAPRYDPNHYSQVPDVAIFKNPAVSDQYEPGSTFKTITFGSALDAGVVNPDTTFICNGTISVYGASISNSTHTAHGVESMKQGLARSCNIAADFAATQIGPDNFYKYVQNFGFGQYTDIDMAGEVPGTLWLPKDEADGYYTPLNLYTNAFGQSISVTSIQLITGISALINGGNLMKPHIVSNVSRNGQIVRANDPTVVRRVISPSASEGIKNMMVWAVEDTNSPTRVPGYLIGAKTGTAQIPGPDGRYLDDGTLASVIGFAPAQDPRFIALVLLTKPKSSQWGGDTAAPAFGRLAKELLQYWKIPPTEAINP